MMVNKITNDKKNPDEILFKIIDSKNSFKNLGGEIIKNKLNLIYGKNGSGKTSLAISIYKNLKKTKQKFPKKLDHKIIEELEINQISGKNSIECFLFTDESEILIRLNRRPFPPSTKKQKFQNRIELKNFIDRLATDLRILLCKIKSKEIEKIFKKKTCFWNSFFKENADVFKINFFEENPKKIEIIKIIKKEIKKKKFLFEKNNYYREILSKFDFPKKKAKKISELWRNFYNHIEIFNFIMNKLGYLEPHKMIEESEKGDLEIKKQKINKKSSGQQTKIVINEIIINVLLSFFQDSKNEILVILDDPNSSLDLENRHKVINDLVFLVDFFKKHISCLDNSPSLSFIVFTHSHNFFQEILGNFSNDKLSIFKLEPKEADGVQLLIPVFKKINLRVTRENHERGELNSLRRLRENFKNKSSQSMYQVDYFYFLITFLELFEVKDEENKIEINLKKDEWEISFKDFKYLLETFYTHAFLTEWWESKEFVNEINKIIKNKSGIKFIKKDDSSHIKEKKIFECIEILVKEFTNNYSSFLPPSPFKIEKFNNIYNLKKMEIFTSQPEKLVLQEKYNPLFLINFQENLIKEVTEETKKLPEKDKDNLFFYLNFVSSMRIILEAKFFKWFKNKIDESENMNKEKINFITGESYKQRIVKCLNQNNVFTKEEEYEVYNDFISFNFFLNFHRHNIFFNSLTLEKDFENVFEMAFKDFLKVLEKY